MTLEKIPIDKIPGGELFTLMDEHQLVTKGLYQHPDRLVQLSAVSDFFLWHEDGEPIALQIEVPNGEPGILEVFFLIEDKTASKRLWNDFRAMSVALRDEWFNERKLRRIQCFVPESRVNMQRMLRAMGFVEETRKGVGMRGYFCFGAGKIESAQIWSLMDGDPLAKDRVEIAYEYAGT